MKKSVFVFFILCNVLGFCAVFKLDCSSKSLSRPLPKSQVTKFVDQTHYFRPTLRYFPYAKSVVRKLGDCLGILGVAAFDAKDVEDLKRAAILVPLDSKKSVKKNVMSTKKLFEEISKKNAEHVKYQITLAIVCNGKVDIGHAYGMCTPEPAMRCERYNLAQLKDNQLSVSLKVIGEKVMLPDLTMHLLQKGDYATAHELLSAVEQRNLCISYGGILHLNLPACLALFK